MSINSEQVLRKMNEIQSKGGEPIGHWHNLRRWLLEPEQVQESFQEAVMNDQTMTSEQKEYWLSRSIPTSAAELIVLETMEKAVCTCQTPVLHPQGYCGYCGLLIPPS